MEDLMSDWTARTLDGLKPRAERYVVRDPKVSGLELRVQPDGTKVWSLRYRVHGVRRRLRLGEYPRVGLAKARIDANRELRKVDGGIDPQAEREATRRAIERAKQDSIEALAESYIERHAKPHKKSWREDDGYLKNEILPVWKGRPVSSLTRRDCRELIQAIADRPAPVYANRILSLLSRMFRFAVDQELIEASPAVNLPKPGAEASSRTDRDPKAYSADEVRTIWAATEDLAAPLRAIYRLGLLTGQRPGEISGMEWAEIDGAWWSIPGARTKNGRDHRVYLTQLALEELARVPRVDADQRVFRGYRGIRQQSEWNAKVFVAVRGREKPRHSLRDTVATGLAECGIAVEDIAKVLNHTYGPRVTAGYNAYSYDKEKRLALTKWERRLRGILDARPNQKVVSMSGAR
jgi:integrase